MIMIIIFLLIRQNIEDEAATYQIKEFRIKKECTEKIKENTNHPPPLFEGNRERERQRYRWWENIKTEKFLQNILICILFSIFNINMQTQEVVELKLKKQNKMKGNEQQQKNFNKTQYSCLSVSLYF